MNEHHGRPDTPPPDGGGLPGPHRPSDPPAEATGSDAHPTQVMPAVGATAVFAPASVAPAAYAPGGDLRGFVAAPTTPPQPRRNLAAVVAVAAVVVVLVVVVAAVAVVRWRQDDRGALIPATTASTSPSDVRSPAPSDPFARPTRAPRTTPVPTRAPHTRSPHTQPPRTLPRSPQPHHTQGPFPTSSPRHTPRSPTTLPWSP